MGRGHFSDLEHCNRDGAHPRECVCVAYGTLGCEDLEGAAKCASALRRDLVKMTH